MSGFLEVTTMSLEYAPNARVPIGISLGKRGGGNEEEIQAKNN